MPKVRNSETAFHVVNNVVMGLIMFLCLYPFWYVICLSLSDSNLATAREIWFWPKYLNLGSYQAVFRNAGLLNGFKISVLRTLIGTLSAVSLSAAAGYSLSKSHFIFRRGVTGMMLVTMYFGGGLIPWYLVLFNLKLTNNFWGYIIPQLYSPWNIIVIRTYFKTISPSLEESAKLDGASDLTVLARIMLPLSMPVLATLMLFTAVFHWNDWFQGNLLMTMRTDLVPLQTQLMQIIFYNQSKMIAASESAMTSTSWLAPPNPESIKMAAVVISTVPILLVYPFLQKYFVKGIMVGSVKE